MSEIFRVLYQNKFEKEFILLAFIIRMLHKRLPRKRKNKRPKGRRNQGRPLKRLLDV